MAKRKYSAKERKAFHMGRAWAAGKDGKRIPCPDEKTKQSFRNGVKATRERKSGGKKTTRNDRAKGSLYVVDCDGAVIGVLDGVKKHD